MADDTNVETAIGLPPVTQRPASAGRRGQEGSKKAEVKACAEGEGPKAEELAAVEEAPRPGVASEPEAGPEPNVDTDTADLAKVEGVDEDGVLLAAKAAAKTIAVLTPPDPEFPNDRLAAAGFAAQYDGDYQRNGDLGGESPWEGEAEPPEWGTAECALRWLRGALRCKAEGKSGYSQPLLYVISTSRLWPDEENPNEPRFKALKAYCEGRLDLLTDEYETGVYKAQKLGELLQDVCMDVDKDVHPRQDEHAGLRRHPRQDDDDDDDLPYMYKLLIAAHALDAGFQAKASGALTALKGKASSTKAPPVKGFNRIMAKLGSDHAEAKIPKPAENADTNRIAWVLEDGAELISAEAKAREVFGKPIRCKNNYHPDFDAPKESKGYRAMLCNYVYDSGKTWGEMQDEVRVAADKVKELLANAARAMGAGQAELAEMTDWIEFVVTEEFGGDVMKGTQAKLVAEIQFMTKDYYAMRKKTHAWYKVVRAENAVSMQVDYMGGIGDD